MLSTYIGPGWRRRSIAKILCGGPVLILLSCGFKPVPTGIPTAATETTQVTETPVRVKNTETPAAGGEITNLVDVGKYPLWSEVELSLKSQTPSEAAGEQVDVVFTGPDGQEARVPAFYDRIEGLWKVRFSPGEAGFWQFSSTSAGKELNAYTGTFTAEENMSCNPALPSGLPDFNCTGMLKYTGGYYLQFENGDYWIKGGVDDPENFLGDAFGDWNAKKAAVDYLSSKGANSIYVITNNIDGDRHDTWPWVGATEAEAKANSNQFDDAKLQQWEDFFTYVQSKGIVLHIVLNDDGAWSGYDHELYLREMIARFGHHPGLIWNIGEEANETLSDGEQMTYASLLQSLDPYNHPVTVHRRPLWPFLGSSSFDLASIQPGNGAADFTNAKIGDLNRLVIQHREKSAAEGRPIPIMIDETPRVTEVNAITQMKMRTEVLYPIYLAGGNFELHYYDVYGGQGHVSIQDLGPMLDDMRRAREFLETLPFAEMSPCNDLLSGGFGSICYGRAGSAFAIYLKKGGMISVDLSGVGGSLSVNWFNPRTGEETSDGSTSGGKTELFTAPDGQDWVLVLGGGEARPPISSPCQSPFSSKANGTGAPSVINFLGFEIFIPLISQC